MKTQSPAPLPRRFVRSVFTKLLVVVFLAAFGITLLVIGYFIAYRHLASDDHGARWEGVTRYLIRQLGRPPDLTRAQTMAQELGVHIYYQGPTTQWATTGEPHPPNLRHLRVWHRGPGYKFGSVRGRPLLILNQNGERFIIDTRRPDFDHERGKKVTLLFLFLLLILLTGAYFIIRWILRPLRPLHEGVQRVSEGELTHRIVLSGKDEFRDLAAAFNTMTQRIGKLLTAKERLLLDVSHELRSPITRMKVAVEMLSEGPQKEGLKEDLQEMERMVTDILETYRSLRDSDNLVWETVDLKALIEEAASLIADHLPGIALHGLKQVIVPGDPLKLKTVLANLLDNAFKYSHASDAPVEIRLVIEKRWAAIAIQDHGQGIPAEAIPFVFEPFYRADSARTRDTGGYGLGLSLCKAIVETHNGTIAIQSEMDQGTTVTVRLPLKRG